MRLVALVGVLAGALELGPVDGGAASAGAEAGPGLQEAPPPLPAPGGGSEATQLEGAATAGVSLATTGSSSAFTPILAARVEVTRGTAAGTVRAHLAALLPLPPGFNLLSLDLGSFVEFESRPLAGDVTLTVRLQPFSATRLVTFDWADAVPPQFPELSPVLSLDLRAGAFSAFAAVRAVGRQALFDGQPLVTVDALAGAAMAWPSLTLEVRAGSFSWGQLRSLVSPMEPAEAWGLAATSRLTWTLAGGVEPPLDLATYATDPGRFERLFAPPGAGGAEVAATVSLEGGVQVQRLQAADAPAAPYLAPAGYADLQARVRLDRTRLHAGARLATVGHLLFGERASPPLAVPATSATPWLSGALGADHTFAEAALTPGLIFRATQPAVLQSGPGQLVVVTGPDLLAQVVPGFAVTPVLATQVSLRWDPVPAIAVLAELEATWDWNHAVGAFAGAQRVLSFGTRTQLFLQGRF